MNTKEQPHPGSATSNTAVQAKASAGRRKESRRAWWMISLGIVALALLGVATWWISASVNDDTAAAPIATFDTPDFHSLLVSPLNPDHILFGSHAGIQESQDGGFTWEDGTLRDADAMQLTVSPDDPETVYATGHNVFQISHDGGQTWQPREHDLPGADIHGFAQDPGDPQRLYAFVVDWGTFTSRDGGATWESLPDQPAGSGLLVAGPGVLYSASGPVLAASRDGGLTWQPLSSLSAGQVISLAVSSSDPQMIYAGTPNGLARSTDGGVTWESLGPQGVPVLAVTLSSSDSGQVLFVSNEGDLYRSDDGGTTWR